VSDRISGLFIQKQKELFLGFYEFKRISIIALIKEGIGSLPEVWSHAGATWFFIIKLKNGCVD
jgi:hypothetical protein